MFCGYDIWMYGKNGYKMLNACNCIHARGIILIKGSCKKRNVLVGHNFLAFCRQWAGWNLNSEYWKQNKSL